MSAPEISIDLSPDPRDRSALLKLLADANVARAGPSHYREFAFLIRDAHTASVEGGLWGSTIYGWFFVEFLFVPPAQRGQGLGSRLLRMAEDAARERGCAGLCLSSYAFQAPGFYEK